jgi:hypothetical protein
MLNAYQEALNRRLRSVPMSDPPRQNGVTRSLAYIRGLHHEDVSAEPDTGGAGHGES